MCHHLVFLTVYGVRITHINIDDCVNTCFGFAFGSHMCLITILNPFYAKNVRTPMKMIHHGGEKKGVHMSKIRKRPHVASVNLTDRDCARTVHAGATLGRFPTVAANILSRCCSLKVCQPSGAPCWSPSGISHLWPRPFFPTLRLISSPTGSFEEEYVDMLAGETG